MRGITTINDGSRHGHQKADEETGRFEALAKESAEALAKEGEDAAGAMRSSGGNGGRWWPGRGKEPSERALGWIAFALMIAVTFRHQSTYWLAELTGQNPRAVNYMLTGLYESALGVLFFCLVRNWTPSVMRIIAQLACGIAIYEGLAIFGCRALISDISKVPQGVNLCQHLTGLPMGPTTGTVYLFILGWLSWQTMKEMRCPPKTPKT